MKQSPFRVRIKLAVILAIVTLPLAADSVNTTVRTVTELAKLWLALVACGFLMIGISSLLPKSGDDEIEWWER